MNPHPARAIHVFYALRDLKGQYFLESRERVKRVSLKEEMEMRLLWGPGPREVRKDGV